MLELSACCLGLLNSWLFDVKGAHSVLIFQEVKLLFTLGVASPPGNAPDPREQLWLCHKPGMKGRGEVFVDSPPLGVQ